MERCEHYTQLLSARLDGELTEEQERELEAHLADCPACRALGCQLADIHAAFPDLEEVPAPEGFAQRVMDRVRGEEKPKVLPLFRRPWFKALVGLAACALVCVGLYQSSGPDRMSAGQEGAVFARSSMEAPAAADFTMDPREAEVFSVEDLDAPAQEADGAAAEKGGARVQFTTQSAPYDAEPTHYQFRNDQYLRVSCGQTPAAPSARVLGSVDSLTDFLAQFPADDLSWVAAQYGEDFFQTGRLLALVVEEGSGSIRHALAPQGLLRDQVTVLRQGEAITLDVAAWLILAEVDAMFEDGDTLDVVLETE